MRVVYRWEVTHDTNLLSLAVAEHGRTALAVRRYQIDTEDVVTMLGQVGHDRPSGSSA